MRHNIIVILSLLTICLNWLSLAKNVPYERDEISWYFHTKFFDEAYQKKDFFSPLWYGYESFDHPPISKYIFGVYLYLLNRNYSQTRNILEAKYGRWDFYYNIKSDPAISRTEFASIIKQLRPINIPTTVIIIVLIYLLFFQLTNSVVFSLVITARLAVHPLFVYTTTILTSDNQVLLFGLSAVYIYLKSLKSNHQILLIASSILTALSIGSKLNGVFIFAAIVFFEIVRLLKGFITVRRGLIRIFAYVFVSFTYWIAFNPALYLHPFQNTWRYFSFRIFQSANIAYYMPQAALNTFLDRLKALYCTLWGHSCSFRFTDGSLTVFELLNIVLFILGLVFGLANFKKKNNYILFWIILVYTNCVGYLINLDNYSGRYFILLQISVFIIQFFGLWSLLCVVFGRHRSRSGYF